MASTEEVIQRLRESRPPATDAFTYLTIVEKSLSPEVLPALQEILEDAELTNNIGWDLVEMLIAVPGSQECLERIARLGNPREVILKVLEVLERTCASTNGDDDDEATDDIFVALTGMLAVLHGRLKVKAPSRFLRTTLDTVLRTYDASSATATAAVIELVRSLSGRKRPPLPTRQSSTTLDTPFKPVDPSKVAPDPEADRADQENTSEPELMARLLQRFITYIIEAYSNANAVEWASRLLEYTFPLRIVPWQPTMTKAFREIGALRARDALMGQLVAVAGDLGLSDVSPVTMKRGFGGPLFKDLDEESEDIDLSAGGFICLTAYRMFARDVFDADYDIPSLAILPDHHALLKRCFDDSKEEDLVKLLFAKNSGTLEALLVIAIYLYGHESISADKNASGFMPYLHQLTFVSLFHPALRVRNAATVLAGHILHADPDPADRLAILEDLVENCVYASLQACAVSWLREEIIAAGIDETPSPFKSPSCFDKLQHTLFPDLTHLKDADMEALLEFWTEHGPFHLQVANFAVFLFGGKYRELAPKDMNAEVKARYVEPLVLAAGRLSTEIETGEVDGVGEGEGGMLMQLTILTDVLGRI